MTLKIPVLAEIKSDKDADSMEFRTNMKESYNVPDSTYISEFSGGSTSIIPNDVNDKEICAAEPKDINLGTAVIARFSARKISSCIIASEPTRSICSFTIALLVVFSYIDKPVFGWNLVKSESIVASRPLYILLLTDLSIIFARLHIERRKILEYENERETTISASREGQTWDSAVKVLENGLVVYQIIRAVFIDFSIYTVVVVLGLSFV